MPKAMNVVAWCGSSSSNIRNRNNSSVNIFSILSLLPLASFPTSFRPLWQRGELQTKALSGTVSALSAQTCSSTKLSPDNHWSPFWALISKTFQNSLANFWLHYVAFPSLSEVLPLVPCSPAVLLHFVATKLCNVSVTAFGAHPVPPPWACGHWAPCLPPTLQSSSSLVVLSALCGYSPFHFILHILLWQPLASYIFYYYVCLSACGKYTPWPPLVPQCLPVPSTSLPAGLGPSEALKCAFRTARWAASLHSSLIVWMMTTTTTTTSAMPASSVQSP